MKTSADYMTEANTAVPRIAAEDAIKLHGGGTVFVDVRDSGAIAQSGTIKGAHRIARGMLEFTADEATKFHNPALQKDAKIALVCGAGGQAALAGKTLMDMGYANVMNIGGFDDWHKAGGACEDG